MSSVIKAIHVERHDVGTLRYFTSPSFRATRAPDLAWHACTDLWQILGLENDEIEHILRSLRRDWRDPTTVATSEGPVVIQPHFMGEGLLDAVIELMPHRADDLGRARGSLRRGCTAATKAQVPHLVGMRYLAFHLEALGVEDSAD